MKLPFQPPLAPMLSAAASSLPSGDGWQFEPKWDAFRTLVFRDGSEILLQSRDERLMGRYFPELVPPLLAALPDRCNQDGEVVIAGAKGLDFEALLLRIHPAASRVKLLAAQSPASYVAWNLLAIGDEDLRELPLLIRQAGLEQARAGASKPVHLSPATYDRGVAGFRWHKNGEGVLVGSRLLGLSDNDRRLSPRRRAGNSPPNCSRYGSVPWKAILGGTGPMRASQGVKRRGTPRRKPRDGACRGRPAAGTTAKTSAGSRCGWSGCARPRTTTCRGRASATRRSSSAGVRTSGQANASSISLRSRRRTSWNACSATAVPRTGPLMGCSPGRECPRLGAPDPQCAGG